MSDTLLPEFEAIMEAAREWYYYDKINQSNTHDLPAQILYGYIKQMTKTNDTFTMTVLLGEANEYLEQMDDNFCIDWCKRYKGMEIPVCKECENDRVISHWIDNGWKCCPFCTRTLSVQ